MRYKSENIFKNKIVYLHEFIFTILNIYVGNAIQL